MTNTPEKQTQDEDRIQQLNNKMEEMTLLLQLPEDRFGSKEL